MEKETLTVEKENWFAEKENWGELLPANDPKRHYTLLTGDLFPLKLFGQADADTEWLEDKDRSSKLFVHTDSFETFKHKSNLFIFGRRGTGKTALIKMLDYEIKKGVEKGKQKPRYNYSKIIYQDETFFSLTLELRPFLGFHSAQELTHVIREKFIWVIYTTAMMAVTKNNRSTSTHLINIRKYLADENLIESEGTYIVSTPIGRATKLFSDSIASIGKGDSGWQSTALTNALRQLDSAGYREALNSLVGYLTEEKEHCLVLIDSQELYGLGDTVSECAVSGLIEAVLNIFNQYANNKILAKAAFPSEMVPHLRPANRGKMNDKQHFIFWKYHDLLRFISKRYCQLLNEDASTKEGEATPASQKTDCEQIKDDPKFVYQFMPKRTESFSGIDFDSIAYIISHTQKKPREVIMLFNVILSMAKQNGIPFTKLTSDCIREGTNARVEDLSSGVTDMYRNIFKGADRIIKKTFNNSECIMTYGEMHKKLRDASSLFDGTGMSKTDIERLFTESGVIGVVESFSKIGETNKFICEANFEYQIKNVMTLQSHDILAIHPMFYQDLNARVYSNLLVCPKPSRQEQQEMDKPID